MKRRDFLASSIGAAGMSALGASRRTGADDEQADA